MKSYCKTLLLTKDAQLLEEGGAPDSIIIEIARDDHFPENRKKRKEAQSQAARDLLDHILKRSFQDYEGNAYSIKKTDNGKPFLTGEKAPLLSLSHSGKWVACAVNSTTPIGIDIEVIKSRNWSEIKQTVFHPKEILWIFAAENKERDIRAITCWCRKEAFVKAIGVGLTIPLPELGFSPEGNLISLPSQLNLDRHWKTHTTTLNNELVIATAWEI